MPLRNPARPVIDFIVLAVLLVVSNLVLSGGDRGWLSLNPNPYLLLPLLIGGKYGLRSGFVAGLVALVICVGIACSAGVGLMAVLKVAPLVFLALPVVGLISGELNRQAAGAREALEVENLTLSQSKQVYEADLEVARESQHLLQKELTLAGADVCSLDVELRKIFDDGAPPVLQGTLRTLAEVSGVSDAAFYLLDEKRDGLGRAEFIGDGAFFPESIGAKHTKMAWAAIEAGELVTCRGLGEGAAEIGSARFLAALPWRRNGEVAGVLLVHDMPFLSMNWPTLARIELVCDWVAAMEDVRGRTRDAGGLGEQDFKSMLGLAGRSAEQQGLKSTVAVLVAAGALSIGEICDGVAGELRSTDVVVEVGDRALAVLLPMEAGRDADALVGRFREALGDGGEQVGVNLLELGEGVDPGAVWEAIQNSLEG